MSRWTDPDNPERNEWCPITVDTLATGDGVACGRFATVRLIINDRPTAWICTKCMEMLKELAATTTERSEG